jgi:hypothetical protein
MRKSLYIALFSLALLIDQSVNVAQNYEMPKAHREKMNSAIVNIHEHIMAIKKKYAWLKGYDNHCLCQGEGMCSILYQILPPKKVIPGKQVIQQMPEKLVIAYTYLHADPNRRVIKPFSEDDTPVGCIINKYECRLNVFINCHSKDKEAMEGAITGIATNECNKVNENGN